MTARPSSAEIPHGGMAASRHAELPGGPRLVKVMVPKGTMLDTYQGVAYVSVVGFLFLNTRLLGIPVPWHRDFGEPAGSMCVVSTVMISDAEWCSSGKLFQSQR